MFQILTANYIQIFKVRRPCFSKFSQNFKVHQKFSIKIQGIKILNCIVKAFKYFPNVVCSFFLSFFQLNKILSVKINFN